MKSRILILLCMAIAFVSLACLSPPPAETEAGIFRNRFGEPRQPLRRLAGAVRAVASARFGGCAGMSSGCSGVQQSAAVVCENGVCSVVSSPYNAPDAAADDAAAKAFFDALNGSHDEAAAVKGADAPPRAADTVPLSVESSRVIPLPDARLAARERRLGPIERAVFNLVKARPDLRLAIAKYGEARGMGAIDPNNLSQILDVLLQFFTKLLPLILQLIGQQTPLDVVNSYVFMPAASPPLVLIV